VYGIDFEDLYPLDHHIFFYSACLKRAALCNDPSPFSENVHDLLLGRWKAYLAEGIDLPFPCDSTPSPRSTTSTSFPTETQPMAANNPE
jgi:hypothetical protein